MFRVVKSTCINSLSDDKIVTDGTNGHIDVANSYLGFDIYIYMHFTVNSLYYTITQFIKHDLLFQLLCYINTFFNVYVRENMYH